MSEVRILIIVILSYIFGFSESIAQIISIDTLKNISRSAGDDMAAEWSPDGQQLIYQSNRNGN